ncbi:MAG: hypothetical protein ACI9JT_000068 [Polaribacter sp.]|jgi:hypothetical protein
MEAHNHLVKGFNELVCDDAMEIRFINNINYKENIQLHK